MPDAFAAVREAARRTVSLEHFDVQLMAGIAFPPRNGGRAKTGEGKTLSATTALYLNALTGRGAHLVTVNDYLARRDCGWMGPIYHSLGMTVGGIYAGQGDQPAGIYDPEYKDPGTKDERLAHLKPVSRKEAYAADITTELIMNLGLIILEIIWPPILSISPNAATISRLSMK